MCVKFTTYVNFRTFYMILCEAFTNRMRENVFDIRILHAIDRKFCTEFDLNDQSINF